MSDAKPGEGAEPPGHGATTAVSGTPFPVDRTGDRRARINWVAFLAGPVLWFTHFMVVYLVAEAGCTGEGPGLEVFDPPVPQVVTLAATAVAALACLYAAAWAYRRAKADISAAGALDRAGAGTEPGGEGSMAFPGFLLSLLSTVAIVFVGVPAAFLPAC